MQSKLGKMDQALNKLKALSASTPAGQLLRSVAVAYAFASTVNDGQKFLAAQGATDKTLTGLETLTAAAGLVQKGANLANGFELPKSGSLWSSFAKDTANGTISLVGGSLDLVEGIRALGGLGENPGHRRRCVHDHERCWWHGLWRVTVRGNRSVRRLRRREVLVWRAARLPPRSASSVSAWSQRACWGPPSTNRTRRIISTRTPARTSCNPRMDSLLPAASALSHEGGMLSGAGAVQWWSRS